MPARRPLFALVIGLNALLLFLVQPLAGKLLLPLAGGSPAVWSGCLLFFQGALLAGYALAHVGARWLAPRALVSVHVVVLVLAMPTLPIGIDGAGLPPADADPTWWILWTLVTSLGLPFTALAAGAPLLQHYFAATAGPSDGDPYALYAASNTGSLLALFAYPFLVEPWLPVSRQRVGWTALYGVLVLLLLLVARAVAAARAAQGGDPREEYVGLGAAPGPDQDAAERIPPAQVARWLLLSFVPTALLMAVTAFITTDVAAVPLLWILPLGAFLLTFTLGFAERRDPRSHALAVRLMPLALLTLVSMTFWEDAPRGIGIVAAPTIAFFLIALVLHGELHRRRPSPRHLTAFHLTISLGGVLGGVFVVLVAPLLFTTTLELPIALALAAWCIPVTGRTSDAPVPTWQWVATLAFAIGITLAGIEHTAVSWEHGTKGAIAATVAMATALLTLRRRPLLFGIAATAIVGGRELRARTVPGVLTRERSFFGTHVVRRIGDQYGTLHAFMHGRTLHGAQHSEPALRNRPLTYYAFDGPLGELFNATFTRATPARVGVVGLGVGSTAAYARVGDRFTFFEIDPTVARMARDTTLFTYLHDAPSTTSIVLGDGRRSLAKEPAGSFDLLLIDAFSSDAIPVHLATREAVALYLGRLREGGLLAFHVSNRYLELDAVLAAIADEAGLVARERTDLGANSGSWVLSTRHLRSQWVVLARDAADVALLDDRWRSYSRLSHLRGWTDDYSNLAASFAWGRRTVNTVADPIAVTAAPDTATPDASAPATTAPHEPSRDRGRRAPR